MLSEAECDGLIELAQPARPLTTVDNQTGGDEVNSARTSDGMFFNRGENPLCEPIERGGLRPWCAGPTKTARPAGAAYRHGAQYVPHYDYFDPAQPGTPRILQRGGQRVGTIVMYLRTPERGGATVFPDVGLPEVAPIKEICGVLQLRPAASRHQDAARWLAGNARRGMSLPKWMRAGEFV